MSDIKDGRECPKIGAPADEGIATDECTTVEK